LVVQRQRCITASVYYWPPLAAGVSVVAGEPVEASGLGVGAIDIGGGPTDGVLVDVSGTLGVDDALESTVEEAEVLLSGETVLNGMTAGTGAEGAINTIGAVEPSDTVSCSAGDAKECQSNVIDVVVADGIASVKPELSFSAMNPGSNAPSGKAVTIGSCA